MSWSFEIGKIKGIPIKVHATFFLILIWGAMQYGGNNGLSGLIYGAILTLLVFAIVLLHELGHSIAARFFGIEVKDITMLPIGGLARLERMPDKPVQELVVAAAGPAVNVVLMFALLPILLYQTDLSNMRWQFLLATQGEASFINVVSFLILINLTLLIFNLIPAFPLDGGRIFRAFLAMFLQYTTATRLAVMAGQGFALLLGLFGLMNMQFFMVLVAIFIFMAGGAENRSSAVKKVLDAGKAADALTQTSIVLQPNYTVMEVASLTLNSRQSHFPVMLGDALIGILRRLDVRQALEQGKSWSTVAEIMHRDFPSLKEDTPLLEVQEKLFQSGGQVAAIYRDTQFLGLVGFEDLEQAFYRISARQQVSQPA